jgi:protein O-GlcNAc transferase
LWSMDYRLTDPYLDPPGKHDEYYSETSIRLPETFFHYEPLTIREALTVSDHSRITFACLGEFERVNDLTLDLWKRILEAVPDSRLILLAGRGDHRAKTIAKLGVASARIDFLEPPGRQQYLNLHDQIDVRLDTFPYNGQMSSLDSWWMGVPVVSLCGRTAVSRCGFSIASNLGLANLVAHTPDDYVRIAKELAADSSVRGTLRRRMSESPLMDGAKMIRSLEAAYRTMWRNWCESK